MFSLGFRILGGALLAALAITSLPQIAVAQTVTVTINGQPLYLSPGPIERAGRVFVPLRGIFERLGATVVYASGTINATKGATTISLQIGSTQATVSGQPQTLDVAPFIVGATTYVPLRFIAQSLGAQVGYDAKHARRGDQRGAGHAASRRRVLLVLRCLRRIHRPRPSCACGATARARVRRSGTGLR